MPYRVQQVQVIGEGRVPFYRQNFELKAPHKIYLPPSTSKEVDVSVQGPDGGNLIATVDGRDLLVIGRNGVVPIEFQNPTRIARTIEKGENVGEAQYAMKVEEVNIQSEGLSSFTEYSITLDSSILSSDEKEKLTSLINDNIDIFSSGLHDIGRTKVVKHEIDTGNSKPIRGRPYKTPFHQKEIIKTEVKNLLDANLIKPSNSAWSAPVVLVKKKDNTWMFCILIQSYMTFTLILNFS